MSISKHAPLPSLNIYTHPDIEPWQSALDIPKQTNETLGMHDIKRSPCALICVQGSCSLFPNQRLCNDEELYWVWESSAIKLSRYTVLLLHKYSLSRSLRLFQFEGIQEKGINRREDDSRFFPFEHQSSTLTQLGFNSYVQCLPRYFLVPFKTMFQYLIDKMRLSILYWVLVLCFGGPYGELTAMALNDIYVYWSYMFV